MISVIGGQPIKYRTDSGHWFVCCDCGLSHLVFFEVVDKKTIKFTAYRDNWDTIRHRQKMSDEQLDGLIKELQAEKRRRKRLKRG